jgi:catechol 2,3-dioxygenase-like lactoylglutathione lyase family enzyme
MDRTLEVVILPVSDIDRAVEFYRATVGFELDHDPRTATSRATTGSSRGP